MNRDRALHLVTMAAARWAERLYDGEQSLAYDGEAEDLDAALELLTDWKPGMRGGPLARKYEPVAALPICAQRGWHRFVVASPDGTDAETFDECLECGAPAPVAR